MAISWYSYVVSRLSRRTVPAGLIPKVSTYHHPSYQIRNNTGATNSQSEDRIEKLVFYIEPGTLEYHENRCASNDHGGHQKKETINRFVWKNKINSSFVFKRRLYWHLFLKLTLYILEKRFLCHYLFQRSFLPISCNHSKNLFSWLLQIIQT